ncbi:MAG: EF-hand domain-containing protein [Polyangiaceae bacterium]
MAISGIGGGVSNLNTSVSAQERAQKLMKQMDADNDGKVSKQEFVAFGEKMKANGPKRAQASDAAAPSRADAPQPPSADDMFAKADQDGDGSLSIDDLSAMIAEHETHAMARGGGHHGGAPGAGGPPPGGAAGGGGAPSADSGSSSSTSSESSDPADTNHDGKVSAMEKLAYQLSQSSVSSASES